MIVEQQERLQRSWGTADAGSISSGSAGTLPMSDEEKQAVVKRPVGFVPAESIEPTGDGS